MALEIQRIEMVKKIEKKFKLHPYIKKAFLEVNRKSYVPIGFGHIAYELDALPIQQNQWISSPLTVAKMTQYLEIQGVDKVLEIGCGSGYQAAILSKLCRRVFTIERIDSLLKDAKDRFRKDKINNIFTRFDDGQRGWREYAPYDRILFSATTKRIPEVIFEQLAEGGTLLAPIEQNQEQIITKFKKINGQIISYSIEPCRFVPIMNGRVK
jgi:protein-L-isoaspartate(D-aspartate) O-methyltransferase